MTQPTALFLADILEDAGKPADIAEKCAAELRRLHASCEDYAHHKQRQGQRILKLYAQRDALLEALSAMLEQFNYNTITGIVHDESAAINKARAAIKAVEEGK